MLCRSLPQVHENHENVQGFSKQCSLYHPLWHLRHLMSRLPRFEGQVPHKVVVNLILISHVLQDSVPNSREIWRKLCHLPKNHSASQASQDISSIDAMLRLSPTHILRFIPQNRQTLKCFLAGPTQATNNARQIGTKRRTCSPTRLSDIPKEYGST